MAYTGGDLNFLNGKYGISAPNRSVPVMKLIKFHQPKTKDELCQLIHQHAIETCVCGVKSQGTVEDFGKNLYNAQWQEWGNFRYSLQACIQWEYDLFIVQSLKGNILETKAHHALLPIGAAIGLQISFAEGYLDEELRIDLLVSRNETPLCGIQVKPLSFNLMREGVLRQSYLSNQKWGKPVFYLFYDEEGTLVNFDETVERMLALVD